MYKVIRTDKNGENHESFMGIVSLINLIKPSITARKRIRKILTNLPIGESRFYILKNGDTIEVCHA